MFETGVRIKEYCGLRWDDVNLKTGVVKIRREITKTDAGVRKIYMLNERLIKLLKYI